MAHEFEVERYELREGPAYDFTPDRRGFLKLAAAGIFVFLALPLEGQESGRGRRGGNSAPTDLAAWLHIAESGRITVYSGKAELGQNIRTSLTQAVAEELHAPVSQIDLVLGDTALTPYDMGTFGSLTTPQMAPQLRRAAVAARMMLASIAADLWNEKPENIQMAAGKAWSGGKTATYGELAKGRKLERTVTADLKSTPAREWKVAGHDLGKLNIRSIVTGQEQYVSDIHLPGMLYGRVVRPAAFRSTLVDVDASGVKSIPGAITVRDKDFLGVVTAQHSNLERAAKAVQATWNTAPQIASAELYNHLKETAEKPVVWRDSKAEVTTAATYTIPYIAHTPLEPRAAVASWEDGKLTVWTGSQRPFGVRSELAQAFGIPESDIRVIIAPTGSAYGGKHTGECAVEAARLAKAAGKPVKLVWTREEEFTWAYFRPAALIEVRAGASKDGTITDWQFHNYNSGNAALRSPYNIPGQVAEFHPTESPLRQGSYRALAATANHFARECHMDELAFATGLDPAAFRLKNASDPRLQAVIEAASEKFRWGKAKSREGQGFGMMAGFDKGDYIACCVEVTVLNGKIRVDRVVQSFECGAIVNPQQLKNLVSGSVVQGLGGALSESIDFAGGKILNPRLSAYRVPRFRDLPEIEIVLVDRKDLPSAGAGETAIVGIAPAIGNAVFNATGKRLRSLPIKPA